MMHKFKIKPALIILFAIISFANAKSNILERVHDFNEALIRKDILVTENSYDILNQYLDSLELLYPTKSDVYNLILTSNYYHSQYKLDSAYSFLNSFEIDAENLLLNKVWNFQMGLLFLDLKYYEKSKEYFEKSYKIKALFNKDYFLSNYVLDEQVLGYIANVYLELNEPEKAKNIYKRLIVKYELLGKAKLLGSKVRQLTNLLYSNNETSEAEAVLLKFQNSNFLDSADFCVQYYSAYAFLLFNRDSLDKAIEYEKLSLKWRKQNGFHKMIMNSNVSIARYFVAKGILDSATYYFDQADKYFSTRTVINSSIYYYNVRAYYYQAIGDTLNYKKTLQIKNSIAYQKELTNKFFKAAQTIISKDNKLNKTKSGLKLFIAIAIAFFVLLIIIIYLLYKGKKINKDLNQKTQSLNNEIKSHIETHKSLENQLSQKNKLIGIISHDLINPLGASITLIDFALDIAKDDDELLEILESCKKSISDNRNMLNEIMKWIVDANNKYEYNPEYIQVYELVNVVYEVLKTQIKNKELNFFNNLKLDERVWVDPQHIQVVFRNVIQNSIKFTEKGGSIVVDYYTDKNFLFLTIEDTGKGMDQGEIEKLFDSNRLIYSAKKKPSEGHGFGMIISKEFITLNRGDIFVDSIPNKGTKFTLKLPRKEYE